MHPEPPADLSALREAVNLMSRLRAPDGCPWDREQTFDSIKRHTLEETYEVFDAIDRRSWLELKDELGDLLLQVLFYAQMASEAGHFTIADVAASLNSKLIRRHPHIFGTEQAATADDVRVTWERVKREERKGRPEAKSVMDGVPAHVPAMLEAERLGAAAAKVGFDWPESAGVFDKLREETAELEAEVLAGPDRDAAVRDELGDLLFTAVHLARHLGVEPEFVLKDANRKFRDRFVTMEQEAGGREALQAMTPELQDRAWRRAKERSRAGVEDSEADPPPAAKDDSRLQSAKLNEAG